MNRRSFLRQASYASLAALCAAPQVARAARPQKLLFFTKSSGFEHSVISYKKGQPSLAEAALKEICAPLNWEVTFSKDGSLFTEEYLRQWDAFIFYTTGNLCEPGTDGNPPMSEAGKAAFLKRIEDGAGFVGLHSATDTFHTANEKDKGPDRYENHGAAADPYVRMIGDEFIKHNKQQKAMMRCVDPKFPGLAKYAEGFLMLEEWYSLKDFRDDLHVVLVQETAGMEGKDYQRQPYPATWARRHGQGNVFYSSMGHRDDVWSSEIFRDVLVGGLSWALKQVEADTTPNLQAVAPRANELQPYYQEPKKTAAPAAPTVPQ